MLDGCDHHRDPTAIPLHEATRLLLNRASGLLFAADLLRRPTFEPADADFVGRNLAKARLALGDVVLTAFGRYHDRCAERHRRMAEPLPADADAGAGEDALPMAAIREHHAAGVRFKFHPSRSTASAPELTTAHRELVELTRTVWLWLERRRLDIPFDSPAAYSRTPHPLCPETPPLRNRLVNARAFGPRFALLHRDAGRHPRERLLRSLPLLLFDPTATLAPDLQPLLANWLASDVQDPPGLVAAYRSLWNRFS
jgi:hypothetical protein